MMCRRKVLSPLKEFNNAHDDNLGEMDYLMWVWFYKYFLFVLG